MFDGISVASRLAKAVAFAEGCIDIHENYHRLSLPYRLNNPCDLKVTNSQFTSHRHSSGKLLFADLGTGWNAGAFQMDLILTNRSHVYNNSMTIQEVANHYAKEHETPLEQQNADHWTKNVALFLGVQTTTTLVDLLKRDEMYAKGEWLELGEVTAQTPKEEVLVGQTPQQEVLSNLPVIPKSSFASKFKKEQ